MRKLAMLVVLFTIAMTAMTANAKIGFDVGLRLSSLGYGVEVSKTVFKKLDTRATFQLGSYQTDGTIESKELKYDTKFNLSSWSLLADYHVFGGNFFTTVGVIGNGNKIDATVGPSASRRIGSRTYTATEQGSLTANITWPSMAPYVGVGFGGQQSNEGHWRFELGAMFQGSPKVSMSGTGMIAPSAANAPTLEDDLAGAKTWLVTSISYRFSL